MDNNGNNFNNKNYPNGSFNNPNTTQTNNYNRPDGYNQQNNYNQQDYNQHNYNYNQPNDFNQQNYNYNQPNNFNQQNYGFPNKRVDPGQNMATASLVCGIIAYMLPYGLGLIAAILAIIFSVVSANKSQEAGLPRNGMATAGLICGIIACATSVITLIACFSIGSCTLCYAGSSLSYPYY
ncbi:MAG: DUF4190 domain-containing protein [Acutalibacteraceae bacterium]